MDSGRPDGPQRGPTATIFAYFFEGIAALFVAAVLGLVLADIMSLTLGSKPAIAPDVLSYLAVVGVFVAVAALISSDRAVVLWPPRQRSYGPAQFWTWLGPLFTAIVLCVVAAALAERGADAVATGETSDSSEFAIAPFILWAMGMAVVAAMVAVANMIRAFLRLGPLAPKDPELDI